MPHVTPSPTPVASPAGVGQRILRATGALMIIQVVLRLFGIIEKIVLSHYFGTNPLAEAYFAARRLAFIVFEVIDQVIMHSFLPVFVKRLREQGEADAWRLASTTLNGLLILLVLIAVGGWAFTPEVLRLFVPDWFSGGGSPQATEALRLMPVMIAAVVFLATSSLTYCLLNSYKQFALPASADLVLKGTVLVFAVLLARQWGPLALAVGFLFGALGKLLVHSISLGARLRHYRPIVELKHPGSKQFVLLALPLLIGVLVSQVRKVMDTRFLSSSVLPDGSLPAFEYARGLCDVPVQFFPFVFGIALFPFLADIAAAGDFGRLRGMLMTATRMMILIFVPLALAVILWRDPLVMGIYGSQEFDQTSALLTTAPLRVFAIGMLIGALEIIILQFFFAIADTLRPTLVGMALVPVHVAIAYLGVFHWGWGGAAIAIAWVASKGIKVLLLFTMIRQRLQGLEGARLAGFLGRMLLALVPFVLLLWVSVPWLPHLAQGVGALGAPVADHFGGFGAKVVKLFSLVPYGLVGGGAFLAYLGVLHSLRVEEVQLLQEQVLGRLRQRAAAKR
jgi:putative peptidoglycan lipid II flippase